MTLGSRSPGRIAPSARLGTTAIWPTTSSVSARPCRPGVAFAFMADLTNFERWDPGVVRAEQVVGVAARARRRVRRHRQGDAQAAAVRHQRVRRADARGGAGAQPDCSRRWTRSRSSPTGDGSVVTYDARLTLNGPLARRRPARRRRVRAASPSARPTASSRRSAARGWRTSRPDRAARPRRRYARPRRAAASVGSTRGRTAGRDADGRRRLRAVGPAHPLLARAHRPQRVRAHRLADHVVGRGARRRADDRPPVGGPRVRCCATAR